MRSAFAVLLVGLAVPAMGQTVVEWSAETLAIPGNQAGDTALWHDPFGNDRKLVFGSDALNANGVFGFFIDGGTAVSLPNVGVGGVDSAPFLRGLPDSTEGGLLLVSSRTAGTITAYTSRADGGFVAFPRPAITSSPGAVAFADFGDAGLFVFSESGGPALQRWALGEDGGNVEFIPRLSLALPLAPSAIASWPRAHRLIVSLQAQGIVELNPADSTLVSIVDAGPADVASGLALYPQRDGGALLLTAVPNQGVVRVYRLNLGLPAELLANIAIAAPDGGVRVTAPRAIELSSVPFGPGFDAGVLVVSDPLSTSGARYRLVSWEALANAVTPALPIDVGDDPPGPAPLPPRLVATRAIVTPAVPVLDVELWPSRDELLFTVDGVSAWPLSADAGSSDAGTPFDGGAVTSVDVVDVIQLQNAGLFATTGSTPDAGLLRVWFTGADGGRSLIERTFAGTPGPLAITDFGDAGATVVVASGRTLSAWPVREFDGGLELGDAIETRLPFAVNELLAWPGTRRLYASGNAGVLEVNLAGGAPRLVVDGGADAEPVGLALYPQRDGGALLLTSVPARQRLQVFSLRGQVFPLLAEFSVTSPDGGLLPTPHRLDVTAFAMGRLEDGGSRWPTGLLALGVGLPDAGTVLLVEWGTVARSATPRLPIDAPVSTAGGSAGGGTAGGGRGGGGTSMTSGGRAGGTGGGDVEEPKGCCAGAPSEVGLPVLGFLLWLARFQRRRGAKGPADSASST